MRIFNWIALTVPACLLAGCATKLTVQKPYAEVQAGMQKMAHILNTAPPALDIKPAVYLNPSRKIYEQTPALRSNFVIMTVGTNIVLTPRPQYGNRPTNEWFSQMTWSAMTSSAANNKAYFLSIHEESALQQTIPNWIQTVIRAKPAGPERTKVRIKARKYGLLYNWRDRKKERQWAKDLSDVINGVDYNPRGKPQPL